MDITHKLSRGESLLCQAEQMTTSVALLCGQFAEYRKQLSGSESPRDILAAEEIQMAVHSLEAAGTILGVVEHFAVRSLETIERRSSQRAA